MPDAKIAEYSALKPTMNGLTARFARELAPYRARVISVSPGPTLTDLQRDGGFQVR